MTGVIVICYTYVWMLYTSTIETIFDLDQNNVSNAISCYIFLKQRKTPNNIAVPRNFILILIPNNSHQLTIHG